MNFNDITYTIPHANIFSGIEPCLAVTLASIPMMRPLLGRTNTTPIGTGATPVKSRSRSKGSGGGHLGKGSRGTNEDGFQPLDDDTRQLWLRPLGPKHYAGISVEDRGDGVGVGVEEDERELVGAGRGFGRGIRVKQEWGVDESR